MNLPDPAAEPSEVVHSPRPHLMFTRREAAPAARPPSPTAPVPVRSPRTSIILAELARQRRLERRQRRFQRRHRCRAWTQLAAWLAALGRRIRSARGPA